jgi:hypothetical protein
MYDDLHIPTDLLNHPFLSDTAKIFYARLCLLCKYAFVKLDDDTLAKLHKCSTKSVLKYLRSLETAKLIKISKDQNERIIEIL